MGDTCSIRYRAWGLHALMSGMLAGWQGEEEGGEGEEEPPPPSNPSGGGEGEDGEMVPEGTGCDNSTSEEVLTVMLPPVEAAPILKPVIVTVKTGPTDMAMSLVPPVVMTIDVAAGAPQVPVKGGLLLALIVGVTPESKNPEG
jgi:hypothetical protein